MKKLLIISVPFLFFLISCNKEDPAPTPVTPPATTYTFAGQMNAYTPSTQLFALDATTGGTFTGAKGGVFTFSSNSFVTLANQPVTGNITVQLIEVYSPMDMMLEKVFPMTASGPLYSGGEYNIVATQNNQQLKLAPGVTYSAKIPNANPVSNMRVFNAVTVNSTVTWVQDSAITDSVYAGANVYNMTCDSIRWQNCDQFPNPGNWTGIELHSTAPVTLTNVCTYIYYDGHNAIFQMGGDPFSGGAISGECWDTQLVHLIVVGVDASGNMYSNFLATTVTPSAIYNVAMTATTPTAFAAQMNALP
jgi:hypothetical protein